MNGVQILGIDGACDQVSLQSTHQGTRFLKRDQAIEHRLFGDELLAVKFNGRGGSVVIVKGLGGSDGEVIVEQDGARRGLAAGDRADYYVREGKTLIIRGATMRMPDGRYML